MSAAASKQRTGDLMAEGRQASELPTMVIVGPVWPYRGGIAHFSNRLSQSLQDRFSIRLLNFKRQYPKFLFPGKSETEETLWKLPSEPVRLIDSIGPASWGRAGRWIASNRPQVVMLVHWLPFFVPAYLGVLRSMRRALKRQGAAMPHVLTFLHNVQPHMNFPGTRMLMTRLVRASDSFFCMSDEVIEGLRQYTHEHPVLEGFHPVYDIFERAIDRRHAREQLWLRDSPTMLFFGLVREYKGLDVLLRAMAISNDQVDAQLIVAGEFYESEDRYRSLIDELGLNREKQRVHLFPEYIPNEEVHLYFSAADVAVQPYRTATPSGVVQTSYYFGTPVIVTDLGVLRKVVQDGRTGYIVPPEDPEELAGAIVRFFRGDSGQMGRFAALQGEKYSWDALADLFESFVTKHITSS
jgi:glycosyltransferase involved in cell wall biosynthesis